MKDLAGQSYIFTDLPKVPALCPIRGDPPTCTLTVPSYIQTIIYIVGGVIILFIIAIIVLSILLAKKHNCPSLSPLSK